MTSDIKTIRNLLDQLSLALEIYAETGNADKARKQLEATMLQTHKEILKAIPKPEDQELYECLLKIKRIESGIAQLLPR